MAPAAAATNWLSFSLSPMEMLATSHHQTPQILPNFLDPFYSNEWGSGKGYTDYMMEQQLQDHHHQHNQTSSIPKLEDFLGNNDSNNNHTTSYNESTTQDSSSQLTHLYDPHHNNYFSHDLKAAMTTTSSPPGGGYQTATFSNNSVGSEVDDATQFVTESTTHQSELGFSGGGNSNGNGNGSFSSGGGNLSLSVVTHSSAENAIVTVATTNNNSSNNNNSENSNNTNIIATSEPDSAKKIADTFGQRTSIYRGVTRHRWTGRYEAHLWDNSCRREGQARKGRQVYLGGYDKEEKAARSYDLAALKYWGPTATTNFPISSYTKELEDMKHATKQEFIASLRRKSSGFSRGASIYRGVTRHHQQGRWQARIGRVAGNKDLYLGTFATEEEAAEAYDIAAIKFRGVNAVTNFEMNRYDVEAILKSNLPIGGAAKRLKLATEAIDQKPTLSLDQQSHSSNGSSGTSSTINFSAIQSVPPISCNMPFDAATTIFHQNLLHHLGSNGASHAVTPESYGSVMGAMSLMPQTPGEFYIWPHQSYQ